MEMVVIHTKNSTAISYLFLTYTVRKKEEHSKKNSVSPRRSVRQTIIRRRTIASNKVVPFDDSNSKEEDVSEGSLSSGKKKMTKVEELLAKKNQIKALNSFNDNTGKRLRILRAQVHLPPSLPLFRSHHISPQTGSCCENQRRCERFFCKHSLRSRVRESSVGNDSSRRNVCISYNSNPCWTWICNT